MSYAQPSLSLSLSLCLSPMESRLKQRIARMFRASFGSCRTRNVSDVVSKPVFISQNHQDFHLIEPLFPKVRTFPSIRRTRFPESLEICSIDFKAPKEVLHRRKITDRGVCFVSGDTEGRTCPPASPISPLKWDFQTKETRKKKSKKTHKKNKKKQSIRLSSSSGETYNGWFSSEDEREEETETFFSSKSFSSDSSESQRRKKRISRRRRFTRKNSNMGFCSFVTKGKIEESFAVVKCSSDPRSDFRTSMVEMIIEKQIFAAKDLEELLQCFLSLNSSHHHRVIVEVFSEIWEALFCNFS